MEKVLQSTENMVEQQELGIVRKTQGKVVCFSHPKTEGLVRREMETTYNSYTAFQVGYIEE